MLTYPCGPADGIEPRQAVRSGTSTPYKAPSTKSWHPPSEIAGTSQDRPIANDVRSVSSAVDESPDFVIVIEFAQRRRSAADRRGRHFDRQYCRINPDLFVDFVHRKRGSKEIEALDHLFADPAFPARRMKREPSLDRPAISPRLRDRDGGHEVDHQQIECTPDAKYTFSDQLLKPRLISFDQKSLAESHSPVSKIAKNASCGISTLPIRFIRFLPSFCLSSSLRLRLMSPL